MYKQRESVRNIKPIKYLPTYTEKSLPDIVNIRKKKKTPTTTQHSQLLYKSSRKPAFPENLYPSQLFSFAPAAVSTYTTARMLMARRRGVGRFREGLPRLRRTPLYIYTRIHPNCAWQTRKARGQAATAARRCGNQKTSPLVAAGIFPRACIHTARRFLPPRGASLTLITFRGLTFLTRDKKRENIMEISCPRGRGPCSAFAAANFAGNNLSGWASGGVWYELIIIVI